MADAKQYLLDTVDNTGDALKRAGEAGLDSAASLSGIKGVAGSMLQAAFNTQGYQDKQARADYARQQLQAENKRTELYMKNADELNDIQMNQARKDNELYNNKHALEMQKVAQQRFATAIDTSSAALQTRLSTDPNNSWNKLTPEQQKQVMKTPQWNNAIQTGVVGNLCVKSMGGDRDSMDTVHSMMRLFGMNIEDVTDDRNNPTGRITDSDGNTFDINEQNMLNAMQYSLANLNDTITATASINPLNTRDNAVWDTRQQDLNNYFTVSSDTDIAGVCKVYDDIYKSSTPRAQFTHVFRNQLEQLMANPQLVNDPHFMQRAGIMIAPNETGSSMLENMLGYSFDPNGMQFNNLTTGEILKPEEMLMRLENEDKVGQMITQVFDNRRRVLDEARAEKKNKEMLQLAALLGKGGGEGEENKQQKPIYLNEDGEITEEGYARFGELYPGKDDYLNDLSSEQVNVLVSRLPNELQNKGVNNGIFKYDGGLGVSLNYDLNSELVDMKGKENELANKLVKGYEGLISKQNSELDRFKIKGDFDPLRLKEKKQAVIDAINKQKKAIEDSNKRIKQQKFDGQARDRSRDFAGVGGGMSEYEQAMQRPPQQEPKKIGDEKPKKTERKGTDITEITKPDYFKNKKLIMGSAMQDRK